MIGFVINVVMRILPKDTNAINVSIPGISIAKY